MISRSSSHRVEKVEVSKHTDCNFRHDDSLPVEFLGSNGEDLRIVVDYFEKIFPKNPVVGFLSDRVARAHYLMVIFTA